MCKKDEQETKETTLTIEEAFERLDVLAQKLESGQTSLEESFAVYQEGIKLLKYCNGKIDRVEKKMLQIDEDGVISEF